jgi:hypothetical protein
MGTIGRIDRVEGAAGMQGRNQIDRHTQILAVRLLGCITGN